MTLSMQQTYSSCADSSKEVALEKGVCSTSGVLVEGNTRHGKIRLKCHECKFRAFRKSKT